MPRVTIKEVARRAGLSIATVSRVINDHPDVAPATRQIVQQVIDELGYEPNAVARSLIHGRSRILGVVSTGIEFYGPSQTMAGIERQANALGYWVMSSLLHDPETEHGGKALSHLLSQQVDGLIWAVPEVGKNREWICERQIRLSVPVVFLHMDCRDDLFVISVDNRQGARLAVAHLLAGGRRRIGCIAGPLHWWETQQRAAGWRAALQEAGRAAEDRLIYAGDWTAASGLEGLTRLLDRVPDLDAVFASNDQMALGVLKAADRLGRRIPDDLAVVGFDDIPEAAYFLPSLTTVRHPLKDAGAQAVTLVDHVLAARAAWSDLAPETIWIAPELLIRDSSR